eukprot:scaffold385_cov182-Ochromonas_danica.AAC.1
MKLAINYAGREEMVSGGQPGLTGGVEEVLTTTSCESYLADEAVQLFKTWPLARMEAACLQIISSIDEMGAVQIAVHQDVLRQG